MDTRLHSDRIIYDAPINELDFAAAGKNLNHSFYEQRCLIRGGFFDSFLEFLKNIHEEQTEGIGQFKIRRWKARFKSVDLSNVQQTAYTEQVKDFQTQGNRYSKKWQDYATLKQISKNPRQAPFDHLREFFKNNGCPVPATSITCAPWHRPPSRSLPSGPTEETDGD